MPLDILYSFIHVLFPNTNARKMLMRKSKRRLSAQTAFHSCGTFNVFYLSLVFFLLRLGMRIHELQCFFIMQWGGGGLGELLTPTNNWMNWQWKHTFHATGNTQPIVWEWIKADKIQCEINEVNHFVWLCKSWSIETITVRLSVFFHVYILKNSFKN